MSLKVKDHTGGDLCKSHAARCDKDFLRICPSKLSKRELEDVYYSLLENNLELKRAVNSQNEKIRMLTTKVQRMTAQTRTYFSKEPRDCCAGAKAAISEQKASIADLKKANDCMAERIRRLNMRLCTAKQFLKRSPNQCVNKCFNCISGASTSIKNLSTSALQDKSDVDNLRTVALSARSIAKISPPTRTTETNTPELRDFDKVDTERGCDENKCRSTMEELKQKIVDLQQELSKAHSEYSARMSQLEEQVSALRAARAQGLRVSHDAEMRARALRDTGTAELESQLKLERGKVAELEMRLKAAEMSREVARTIETHLSNVSQMEQRQRASRVDSERCNICSSPGFTPNEALPTTSKMLTTLTVPEDKHSKSEDSGYADNNRDTEKDGSIHSANRELLQRVAHIQAQVDALKLTADNPDQSPSSIRSKSLEFESYDVIVDDTDVPMLKNVKDYNCVIIDPNKKVIVEIEHVNKDNTDKSPAYTSLNSTSKETERLTPEQDPTNDKDYTDSVLTRQQSKFGFEMNQDRSSVERDSVKATRQKSKIVPELDKASRRSTDESKHDFYRNGKDISGFSDTESRIDSDTKIMTAPMHRGKISDNDEDLASHHTLYKNDIQDDLSHMNENAVVDYLRHKVDCKCPKCKENVNNTGPDLTKRLSVRLLESELPQRVLQESMSPHPTQDASVTDNKTYQKPVTTKLDSHNSLQIPGPLPVDQRDSGSSKISRASAKKVSLQEKKAEHFKNEGISVDAGIVSGNEKTGTMEQENFGVSQDGRVTGVTIGKTAESDKRNDLNNKRVVSKDMPVNFSDMAVKDIQNQKKYKNSSMEPKVRGDNDLETATYSRKSDIIKETPLTGTNNITGEEERLGIKISDVSRPKTSKPVEPGKGLGPSPGNTYTVPESPEFKSRASTPENTENEISVMTDLPTERDGTTPRHYMLSPGEHRATTTYTDSYTPGHDQTLSEGEVPNGTNFPKRKTPMSLGEYPGDNRPDDINPYTQESSAQKMEAALQAISQELARCRSLLHSQRPREKPPSKDAASTADLNRRDSITLRKAEAKPRLSGGFTPKCNFTLHVGTIVLSDEAVMKSRDKPLMLSWKFYDQSVTMTRMDAGRVVHFDFSTEYEVKITEEFLEYLKHDEMPITICEICGSLKPFATCALPLREALLNANRRADLSLALVAGAHSVTSCIATDELGVLDLWCMLRAESKHLALINRETSINSNAGMLNPEPGQQHLAQFMDEDLSNNYRMSQDLDMHMHLNKQKIETNITNAGDDMDNKNDFYVPEPISPNVATTPFGVHSSVRRRKYNAPSISSDLGMTSFETRQLMKRTPPMTSNVIDSSTMDETCKNESCRDTETQTPVKEYEAHKDFQNIADSLSIPRKCHDTGSQCDAGKKVTIDPNYKGRLLNERNSTIACKEDLTLTITVLWLALNEKCDAMLDPNVRRLYVAYSFLGRNGAELETPVSLPKPKHYIEKCYFNFKKCFHLTEFDMPILDHMAKCRSQSRSVHNSKDCIVFTVVSEPPEDPLGLESCEDIGHAFLYLGDLLAYCAGDSFTEVLPVRAARPHGGVCGVLAVRLDGLASLRARPARP